jgi:protein-S-isoprenylcysteine O-methyltransferase Ste14
VLSRLAYAGGVGWALRQEERRRLFSAGRGVEAGFRLFRRIASSAMNIDALSFVVLCLATRGSLGDGMPPMVLIPAGFVLVAAGIGVKLWAARSLGAPAYYWYDFFVPGSAKLPDPPGPYRYLDNPMYTVGYLHAYGFALMCGSAWGLAAAVFDQAAILAFQHFVERPHVARLFAGRVPPHYL